MQVLVVEDEPSMAELLRRGLSEEGHVVTVARDGREALSLATSFSFDAIVLDVMLPGLDGFSVARRLRENQNQTPILFLTARDAMPDVVQGLNLGGDDYLTKPFAFEELLARLRAVARRGPIPQAVIRKVGGLAVDTATREVMRDGERLSLTPTEYNLLELLIRNAGRTVTREAILRAVWGFDRDVESNTLDAFVRLLRAKVDAGAGRKLIHTVRGVGYVLREPEE